MSGQQQTKSPFDVTGPSQLGASLQKGARKSADPRSETAKHFRYGWAIVKMDDNERFLAQNTANFGTRQRRKKK